MDIIAKVAEIAYRIKPNPMLKKDAGAELPLTGTLLQFDAIDMCRFALELMAFYQIRLTAEDLCDQKFNTIRSAAECISGKIS